MTGWPYPERPGVPLNPETPDWHAVLADDTGFAALRWNGQAWSLGPVTLPAAMLAMAQYLGRLRRPDEMQAQLAAARREALEEAARVCDARSEALHDDPDGAALEAEACAAAIRALAVEGANDV